MTISLSDISGEIQPRESSHTPFGRELDPIQVVQGCYSWYYRLLQHVYSISGISDIIRCTDSSTWT